MAYEQDTIELSPLAAEGLSRIGIGDFDRFTDPTRMGCVVFVLPHIPDAPDFFPKGKWATIQEIQRQLNQYGLAIAQRAAPSPVQAEG